MAEIDRVIFSPPTIVRKDKSIMEHTEPALGPNEGLGVSDKDSEIKLTKAETAVRTMIRRIRDDGRLAYLVGPFTQAYEDITDAYAEMIGMNADEFRLQFEEVLRPQRVEIIGGE